MKISDLIRQACEANGMPTLADKIRCVWNARLTRCAGRAKLREMEIELSPVLFERSSTAEKIETVVHEACHLITHARYWPIRTDAHGAEWRESMHLAGYPNAARCHKIDRTGIARKLPRIQAYCLCPNGIQISTNLATRMRRAAMRGGFYTCRKCIAKISLTRESTATLRINGRFVTVPVQNPVKIAANSADSETTKLFLNPTDGTLNL